MFRCFPHIVNLVYKAILAAITKLKHAAPDAAEYVPSDDNPLTYQDALNRDPIAIARLGPVIGMTQGFSATEKEEELKKQEDATRVWRWRREVVNYDQSVSRTTGFQADSPDTPFMHHQQQALNQK